MIISGRERDAYEAGFDAGIAKACKRVWVDLTEEEYAQLAVDYGGDDYALMAATADKLREKNE